MPRYIVIIAVLFRSYSCVGQSESFSIRPSAPDENHQAKISVSFGNFIYAWNEPQNDSKSNLPVLNEYIIRIDSRNHDTLIGRIEKYQADLIPWNYLVGHNGSVWVCYQSCNDNNTRLFVQELDSKTLAPRGELKLLFEVNQRRTTTNYRPFYNLLIDQSDDRTKTLIYSSYYNKSEKGIETKVIAFDTVWSNIMCDTFLHINKSIPMFGSVIFLPELQIANNGTVFISALADPQFEFNPNYLGRKPEDIYIAKISGNMVERITFDFKDKYVTWFDMTVSENRLIVSGTCVYGRNQMGYQDYGTFVILHDKNNQSSTKVVDFPVEKANAISESAVGVKSLLYCDLKVTSDGQIWLVTHDVYVGFREFICQLISKDGELVRMVPVYRLYTDQMSSREEYKKYNSEYPLTTYSIMLRGDLLQIFYHDNSGSDVGSNSSEPLELNHHQNKFNLVMAEINANGEIHKRLITSFSTDKPHQYHYSVLVYRIDKCYYLRCYSGKGESDEMLTGSFTL